VHEKVAIVGSGAIACGLAAVAAAKLGEAVLVARSDESADRARRGTAKHLERLGSDAEVTVCVGYSLIPGATFVVEAIAEDFDCKAAVLNELDRHAGPDAVLATTTSSLSVERLGIASGRPERFAALHVFNPVTKMELVEASYTPSTTEDVRARVRDLCEALGKTAVELPDTPGFVVNRLLFPMLFDAVRLMDEHDLDPADVDTCMRLGAGQPMGPLALLDFIGLDVSIAIGESIGAEVPELLREMAGDGRLGKKAGRGFYDYDAERALR
jgi:3-hydroxybutyryl-CoA dehydrogenase